MEVTQPEGKPRFPNILPRFYAVTSFLDSVH